MSNPIAIAQTRATLELELLANLAGGVRRGLPILAELGIDHHAFEQPDLRLIFLAFDVAQDYSLTTRARLAMKALHAHGMWKADDFRPFVCGMMWGPGPLSVLLTRLAFDESRLIRSAQALIAAIENQNTLERRLRMEAA